MKKQTAVKMAEQCLHAMNYHNSEIEKVKLSTLSNSEKRGCISVHRTFMKAHGSEKNAVSFLQKLSPLSEALPSYTKPGELAKVIYVKAPALPLTPFSIKLVTNIAETYGEKQSAFSRSVLRSFKPSSAYA